MNNRQLKRLKLDNLEEKLSYGSFNSVRYVIFKTSCWNSDTCKGKTIFKSKIYVNTIRYECLLYLQFSLEVSKNLCMFVTMRVVQVDKSERSCFFHSENVLEDSDLFGDMFPLH